MTKHSSGPWQHAVVLQSLYSAKSFGSKAPYFEQSLAQARADVFFSLLFGGTVKASAAAFLDSSIAIRVFGELFSHKEVQSICTDYDWKPLVLNTDGIETLSPVEFLLKRWQSASGKFALFREFDSYDMTGSPDARNIKDAASDCLSKSTFGTLDQVLQDLFEEYRVSPDRSTGEQYGPEPLRFKSILKDGVGQWLKNIFEYLNRPGVFQNRFDAFDPEAIHSFSPQIAIELRSSAIQTELFGPYRRATLISLNKDFKEKMAGTKLTNPFFVEAPSHYGRYYPLIAHWLEADWHGLRQKMYGSETLMHSSDWDLVELFNFDKNSRVYYDREEAVDDSLEVDYRNIVEFDWSSLFSVITDRRWHNAIRSIRARQHIASNVELIFDLAARAQTDFTFSAEKDRVTIAAKRSAGVGTYLGIMGHFHSTLPGLLGTDLFGVMASVPAATVLAKDAVSIAKASAPGMRYLHRQFLKRALRRAVISQSGAVPTVPLGT